MRSTLTWKCQKFEKMLLVAKYIFLLLYFYMKLLILIFNEILERMLYAVLIIWGLIIATEKWNKVKCFTSTVDGMTHDNSLHNNSSLSLREIVQIIIYTRVNSVIEKCKYDNCD